MHLQVISSRLCQPSHLQYFNSDGCCGCMRYWLVHIGTAFDALFCSGCMSADAFSQRNKSSRP